MGVAISGWRLARSVSVLGQLGVVSGTALDVLLARRLQDGDPVGDIRRAVAAFRFPRWRSGCSTPTTSRAALTQTRCTGRCRGIPSRRLPASSS